MKHELGSYVTRQESIAAELSHLVYSDEGTIRQVLSESKHQLRSIQFISEELVFALIAEFDEIIYVVFRGSKGLKAWLNNLDFRVVHTRFGGLHYGFAKSLDSIPGPRISQIVFNLQPGKKICLAGHSRGGAFAVMSALLLTEQKVKVSYVVTFGAPKVGDKYFLDWWNRNLSDCKVSRVVAVGDPVPSLPLSLVEMVLFLSAISLIIYGVYELAAFGLQWFRTLF